MKYLVTIIKKFISKELPKPVGRWRTAKSIYPIETFYADHKQRIKKTNS